MLEFKNVTILHGDDCLVNGLSFVLPTGQSLLLTGRHGAGKTELLRLMMGLEAPSNGYVSIDGALVNERSANYFRRHISYIPQNLDLPYENFADLVEAMGDLRVNRQEEWNRQKLTAQWPEMGLAPELYKAPWDTLLPDQRQLMLLSLLRQRAPRLLLIDQLASMGVAMQTAALTRSGFTVVATTTEDSYSPGYNQLIRVDRLGI